MGGKCLSTDVRRCAQFLQRDGQDGAEGRLDRLRHGFGKPHDRIYTQKMDSAASFLTIHGVSRICRRVLQKTRMHIAVKLLCTYDDGAKQVFSL